MLRSEEGFTSGGMWQFMQGGEFFFDPTPLPKSLTFTRCICFIPPPLGEILATVNIYKYRVMLSP